MLSCTITRWLRKVDRNQTKPNQTKPNRTESENRAEPGWTQRNLPYLVRFWFYILMFFGFGWVRFEPKPTKTHLNHINRTKPTHFGSMFFTKSVSVRFMFLIALYLEAAEILQIAPKQGTLLLMDSRQSHKVGFQRCLVPNRKSYRTRWCLIELIQ